MEYGAKRAKFDSLAICDLCGRRFRDSEMMRISDKYNLNYGLLLCPQDALEKTNLQNTPFQPYKESIKDPRRVRSEQPLDQDIYVIITTVDEITNGDIVDTGGTTASKPMYLTHGDVSGTSLTINWLPPESPGSRALIGWAIKRDGSTLTSNTNTFDLYYTDTTVSSNTQYSYTVAAVTRAGIGAYSDPLVVHT